MASKTGDRSMRSLAQVLWDTISEGRFDEEVAFEIGCGCKKEVGEPAVFCPEHEGMEAPGETPKRPMF